MIHLFQKFAHDEALESGNNVFSLSENFNQLSWQLVNGHKI